MIKPINSLPVSRRKVLVGAAAGLFMPSLSLLSVRAAERRGGTLRIALYKDLRTLNPLMSTFANEFRTTVNLYNNLFSVSPDGGLGYDLAESFEASSDAKIWTVKLRAGVKFHDGSPLEAEDVVATIEKLIDPQTASAYAKEVGEIASLKAVDALTVRFELKSPTADMPKNLASPVACIVSRAGIANFDKLGVSAHGTGPFKLKEFVANDRVVLERNPHYFVEGRPYLDEVVMRVLPDSSTQLAALRNKEVDVIADVDNDTFTEVTKYPGINAMQMPSGTFNAIVLFADQPPFANPDVRLALKLALDRKVMAEVITNGTGSPADDHPISPNYEYFDKSIEVRQPDLKRARDLLTKAGLKGGFKHRLVVATSPASRERTAVVAQAMASQIGIHLELEMMDNARYGDTIWNKGTASYVANYTIRPTEDAILSKMYSAKAGTNEGRWATPESERILDEARASTDPARRRALYAQFQRMARDNGPFIIGNFFSVLVAASNTVKGYPLHPMQADTRLDQVWIEKSA